MDNVQHSPTQTILLLLLADTFHMTAKMTLLYKMLRTKSCAGVSGRSQILIAIGFLARYSDTFIEGDIPILFTGLRVFSLACTLLAIYLIYCAYRKTYDKNCDTFCAEVLFVLCFLLAYFVNNEFSSYGIIWAFSIYLEAVAIVPQMWLTYKVGYADYIVQYLMALGLYRFLHVVHWSFMYLFGGKVNAISFWGAVVQTIIVASFGFLTDKNANTYENPVLSTQFTTLDPSHFLEEILVEEANKNMKSKPVSSDKN